MIRIQRPVYDQEHFNEEFLIETTPQLSHTQRLRRFLKEKSSCSGSCFLHILLSFLPFLNVLKTYEWRKDLTRDVIAGLCVGVIHVPQGMGFAVLTSLPPFYGLYSSFFPVLIYFIFGTSRHISVGTMAIISIMIGSVVEREYADFSPAVPENATQADIDKISTDFKVDIATSVTLLVGLIQFGMGVVRLGVLATFMSLPFIGGFMTGAAFHIATSQAPFMLGIKIPRQVGLLRLPKNWYWICRYIPQTNIADLVISIICIIILIFLRDFINEKFKHKIKIPIPAELIVVVLGTMSSYLLNVKDKYSVQVIESIPLGLPAPKAPSLHNSTTYIVDVIAIAVVSYAISMSLAKPMCNKHRYSIDQNQELIAHGLMHTFSAFFVSFAGAAAPPRTLVHDSSGGKTLLASLVSAALILLVCLVLGPLFEPLPYSVLAAIITVAISPLFKQFLDLRYLWRLNKYDFVVWMLTFLFVAILDVDYGLYIGIGTSLLTVVIETHRGKGKLLIQIENTEIYIPRKLYKHELELEKRGIAVFHFQSPLCFTNVESFKKQLYELTLNPITQPNYNRISIKHQSKQDNPGKHEDAVNGMAISDAGDITIELQVEPSSPKTTDNKSSMNSEEGLSKDHHRCIIIDCSAMTYVDTMGLNVLKQITTEYTSCGVYLAFSNCSQDLLRKMAMNGTNLENRVFPSVIDAATSLEEHEKKNFLCTKF